MPNKPRKQYKPYKPRKPREWEQLRLDLEGHPFNGKTFRLHAICQSTRPGVPPSLREEIWRDNIAAVWVNVIARELPTTTYALYVLPKRDVTRRDCEKALRSYDAIIRDLERRARALSYGSYLRLRRALAARRVVEQHLLSLEKSKL